jgi:hypothetical protein
VPLAPGKPVVQLSPRSAPLDENSVTDEINLTWAVPKVSQRCTHLMQLRKAVLYFLEHCIRSKKRLRKSRNFVVLCVRLTQVGGCNDHLREMVEALSGCIFLDRFPVTAALLFLWRRCFMSSLAESSGLPVSPLQVSKNAKDVVPLGQWSGGVSAAGW